VAFRPHLNGFSFSGMKPEISRQSENRPVRSEMGMF